MPRTTRRAILAGSPLLLGAAIISPIAFNPDAALIRVCAEHIANRDAYNTQVNPPDPEHDPLWAAYMRTHRVIDQARPQTLAGLVAKAQATKAEARNPNGTEAPEEAATWAWGLVNDLLRVGGAAQTVGGSAYLAA